jgi:acyl carrier protein
MEPITTEEISRQLLQLIKNTIVDPDTEVDVDTSFNKLGIDSMAIIELVLFLERKFKITLPETELLPANFKSVATLAACALRNKSK